MQPAPACARGASPNSADTARTTPIAVTATISTRLLAFLVAGAAVTDATMNVLMVMVFREVRARTYCAMQQEFTSIGGRSLEIWGR